MPELATGSQMSVNENGTDDSNEPQKPFISSRYVQVRNPSVQEEQLPQDPRLNPAVRHTWQQKVSKKRP